MFLSWFTFDTERAANEPQANLHEPYHRWMTAQGGYTGNTDQQYLQKTGNRCFILPIRRDQRRGVTGEYQRRV
jgi:phospholipase C